MRMFQRSSTGLPLLVMVRPADMPCTALQDGAALSRMHQFVKGEQAFVRNAGTDTWGGCSLSWIFV